MSFKIQACTLQYLRRCVRSPEVSLALFGNGSGMLFCIDPSFFYMRFRGALVFSTSIIGCIVRGWSFQEIRSECSELVPSAASSRVYTLMRHGRACAHAVRLRCNRVLGVPFG